MPCWVKSTSGKTRRGRIKNARARIEAGYYDAPVVLDAILSPRRLDRILAELNLCKIGDGNDYRDLVTESLSKILGDVVDSALSRTEIPATGGRADIELPLRTEALDRFPLWDRWAKKYEIHSILIEVKNEKTPATFRDVNQLAGYFSSTKLSQFGILVARSGFSRNAYESMASKARDGDSLIIPLRHNELRELGRASRNGLKESMEYLRRRETLLLQRL